MIEKQKCLKNDIKVNIIHSFEINILTYLKIFSKIIHVKSANIRRNNMYTDYIFYLSTLVEEERHKQLLTIILIWGGMLTIGGLIEFIKYKVNKNN